MITNHGPNEVIAIAQQPLDIYEAATAVARALSDPDAPPLPAEHLEAVQRFTFAKGVLDAPAARGFTWPAKLSADTVRKAIRDEAELRNADRMTRIVSAEAAELAASQTLTSLRDVLPAGLARLDEQFKRAAADFIVASSRAPRVLTGRDDEATVAAYVARGDAAFSLDGLVYRRVAIGTALHEARCGSGSIWSFAALPAHHFTTERTPRNQPVEMLVAEDAERCALLADLAYSYEKERRMWLDRDPSARWADLLAVITPSIAGYGATEDRADRWPSIANNVPEVPEMSMLGDRGRQAIRPIHLAAQLQRRANELTTVAA